MITIIICTYNRAALLDECLNSLVNQTYDKSLFKILIVDNNSTDETNQICDRYIENNENIRVVCEKQQGLSYARNKGYKESDTDWVGYLDDDAKARSNWVERANYIINNYPFDGFGGYYLPWYRDGKPDWYLDKYASNLWLNISSIQEMPANLYFSGGNCFFKKEVLAINNGFPLKLGMSGRKIAYGEETSLQKNLKAQGYILGFDPELIIDHYVAKYKQNIMWFMKKSFILGKDHWSMINTKPGLIDIIRHQGNLFIHSILNLKESIKLYYIGEYKLENLFIALTDPVLRSIGEIYSGMLMIVDYIFISRKR